MRPQYELDLVMLVPGKDERETLDGLLSRRYASLRIRQVQYAFEVHPRRDPGCFREAAQVLQPFVRRAARALVVFDHDGSGQEQRPPDELTGQVEGQLRDAGWEDRARVVVIQPELEAWVWSDSTHVDSVLGWASRAPGLRHWLEDRKRWPEGAAKPPDPKECMEAALRQARIQRSSALYRQLAEKVSFQRCQDPAFARLRAILSAWFPGGPNA